MQLALAFSVNQTVGHPHMVPGAVQTTFKHEIDPKVSTGLVHAGYVIGANFGDGNNL